MKYLILNTNNIALQIIPRKHNFDFYRRQREMCRPSPAYLDGPAVDSCRMNNLSLEQLDIWSTKTKYYEYVIDENNISLFGFMDASWGYGRIGMNDDTKIWSQKRQSSF
jgi:hypothetical protein